MALPFSQSKQDSEATLPISESEPVALKCTKDLEAQPVLKSGPGHQPRLARLPTWISFWLGYRKTPPPPEKNYIVWLWSFIGAFSCIAVIYALFGNVPYFVEKGVPSTVSLINSFALFVADRVRPFRGRLRSYSTVLLNLPYPSRVPSSWATSLAP